MTDSWKGRGNQYIQFVRVLCGKLLTNGKKLPAFPLEAMPRMEPQPQRWEVRVLPLCHRGSTLHDKETEYELAIWATKYCRYSILNMFLHEPASSQLIHYAFSKVWQFWANSSKFMEHTNMSQLWLAHSQWKWGARVLLLFLSFCPCSYPENCTPGPVF